jgi:hypothetical protein
MNVAISEEMELRLFRAGAALKGIPKDKRNKILHFHNECVTRSRSGYPQPKDRFDRLVDLAARRVQSIMYTFQNQGKNQSENQPGSIECIENALNQLEQHLKENPPVPPMRCCTCGHKLSTPLKVEG